MTSSEELLGFEFAPTPDGEVLVVASARGIAHVGWGGSRKSMLEDARRVFPEATFEQGANDAVRRARQVSASATRPGSDDLDLRLDLRGTKFQREVWSVLRTIPSGSTMSYGEVAAAVGRPRAARAVGAACGANPAPIVVPCHRVVASDGQLGGFSGELWRKRAMLEREGADFRR